MLQWCDIPKMAAMDGAARFATNVASEDNCCAGGNPPKTRNLHLKSAFRGKNLILPHSSKPQKGNRFQLSRIVASNPVAVETPTQVASRVNPFTKNDLVAYLESGCRPKKDWRWVYMTHEKKLFLRIVILHIKTSFRTISLEINMPEFWTINVQDNKQGSFRFRGVSERCSISEW